MNNTPDQESYEARVSALEAEGITRSDAQAIVDLEDMMAEKLRNDLEDT